MAKSYKINTGAILSSDAWSDATEGELRVLTYLIATGGESASIDAVSHALGITRSRAKSALALWQDSGVIEESHAKTATAPKIEYEFEESGISAGIAEEESVVVAKSIRDGDLAELIGDIAELVGRPTLSTQETKCVVAVYEQLRLPKEYILTLAQFLSEKGVLSPKRLSDEASRLVGRGVDNMELLEKYIEDTARHSGEEWELRKLLGIWGRNLSKTEEKYFKLWMVEYGYSIDIIGEAYDIAVLNTGKVALPYMNKLLSAWSAAGLRTVEDIARERERERELASAGTPKKKGKSAKKTKEAESPLYGDFSSDDALMRALMRSYGDEGGTEK